MYSAVLMLALTAGNDAVDFGRNRCNGCSTSCHGCTTYVSCTSCSSSCHGGGGLFHRNRCSSCSSSCHGTYVSCTSCSSSCHGGGLFHRNRCHSSCSTCSGYYSCACSGGVIIAPGTPKTMPKSEEIKPPKKTSAPATIVINLPADARLTVDGNSTSSTTERRTLVTPDLDFESTYVYTVRAEIVRDGVTMTRTQAVNVRGGEVSNVQFDFSTQNVASR